jgi:hypothetical protein
LTPGATEAYGFEVGARVRRREVIEMASRAIKSTPAVPSFQDIAPRPLAVRSLEPRRVIPSVIERVRGEFIEMRGFSPTVDQAARLFNLSLEECGRVLGGLVKEGFLHRTSDGRYRLPV